MGSPTLKRELLGIALLLFAVFLAGSLGALGNATLRSGTDVRAVVGPVGLYMAYPLVWLVGWPAAVLAPLVPAGHALRLFGRLEPETDRQWVVVVGGVVVLLPISVGLGRGVK